MVSSEAQRGNFLGKEGINPRETSPSYVCMHYSITSNTSK